MDLDLSADLMVETLTVSYGRLYESDTVQDLDLLGTTEELRAIQRAHAGQDDRVTAPILREFLVGKGFKNLPVQSQFAPHALANRIAHLASERKKKFLETLWGPGDGPPEWPATTPASPASAP